MQMLNYYYDNYALFLIILSDFLKTFAFKHLSKPGAYWSCGENVGFWMQRLTVLTKASVCSVLEQDTLSTLLRSTQL